jgi:hypothetical protein
MLGYPLPPVDQGKEAWYPWRLFRKKPHIPGEGITYDGMRDAANASHKAAGIRMHAATHVGRKDAPGQMVKCYGTSEAQVKALGGWGFDVAREHYIRAIPPDTLANSRGTLAEEHLQRNSVASTRDLDTAAEYTMQMYFQLFSPVFFQDAPLWQREWPDSPIWEITWFVKHREAWDRWCKIQLEYVDGMGQYAAAMKDPATQLQCKSLALYYASSFVCIVT